jgi:hypothetical protein
LDTALSNAQAQMLRLEEENRAKQSHSERVKHMTKSLEQLQAASEKREAMEQRLRAKLEEQLREYREREANGGSAPQSANRNRSAEAFEEFRIKLSEAEEKVGI